jgi:TonB-linked SusC/RagA family outer membrane protein
MWSTTNNRTINEVLFMGKKLLKLLALWLVALPLAASAQSGQLSGRVTDASTGEELPGANVYLLEIKRGASTDINGNYLIPSVPAGTYTVLVSYLGYKQAKSEAQIGDAEVKLDIVLKPDPLGLEELVVTALGFEESRDKSAKSTVNVAGGAVARSGESSVLTGLSAKAPGVNITRSGGDPGTGGQILIRGASTITGAVQPLFVVDGVPVSNSTLGAGTAGTQQQSRIGDLNPDDIESVEVLKGASAAVLWGTRAANGVIVIKTKRGKYTGSEKVNISVKSAIAWDQVNREVPLQTTFGQGANGRFSQTGVRSWGDKIANRDPNGNATPLPVTNGTTALINGNWVRTNNGFHAVDDEGNIVAGQIAAGTVSQPWGNKFSKETFDHFGELFQTGVTNDNSVAISGGNETSNYYLNVANWDQTGVVKNNSDYDRTSIRANVEHRFSKKFRSSVSANYVKTVSNRIQQGSNLNGIFLGGLRTPPDFDNSLTNANFVASDGSKAVGRHVSFRNQFGSSTNPGFDNPLWTIDNNRSGTVVNRFIGSVFTSYDPLSWLNVNYRVGVDYYTDRRFDHFAPLSAGNPNGALTEQNVSEYQVNQDLIAQANKQFSTDLSGSFLVGLNLNHREFDNIGGSVSQYVLPNFARSLGNSPADARTGFQSRNTIRTAAMYAEAKVDFMQMFFATATVRGESASTFGPNTESTFIYPSAEFAWQFTNLEALRGNKMLSFGKLRATYGVVGRQPGFGALQTNYVSAGFGESWGPGLSASAYGGGYLESTNRGNDVLKPERKTEVEFGADLRFMDDRIGFSATMYNNRTEDAILSVARASSTGFNGEVGNAAEITNKGVELSLSVEWVRGQAFSWTTNANWFRNRNEVVDLKGAESLFLAGFAGTSSRAVVGEQLGALWGGRWARDENGDYVLDSRGFPTADANEGVIGDPNPDWRAGITNTFRYKGLTVSALIDIKQGGDVWNGTYGALMNYGTAKNSAREVTFTNAQYPNGLRAFNGALISAPADGTPITVRGQIQDFGAGPVLLNESWYLSTGGGFGPVGEQFIEDGSFVRFRELSVSYNVAGKKFRDLTKLQSVDVSFTARNLALWTDYNGIDPETNLTGASNGQGLDYFQNPNTRSYMVGIKFNY